MQIYQLSFYESPVNTTKHKNNIVDLQQFLSLIKDGTYKKEIEQIQQANDSIKLSLKKRLHYATLSGIFNSGARKESTLVNHSGLICLDIDGKENKHLAIEAIREYLINDIYVLSCFLSPSGTGFKAIIQIDGIRHLESFLALENYFHTRYSIVIDKACKDVCRPCFVSYDKHLHEKEQAEIFAVPDHSQEVNLKSTKTKEIQAASPDKKINDIELLCNEVDSKHLDITGNYETWLKIGFAIAEGLSGHGREYFHRLSKFHAGYDYAAADKQFTECLKNRKSGITYSSLFQVAKECGITVHGSTKNIISNSKEVQKAVTPELQKFWVVIEKHNSDGTKQFKGVEIEELSFLRLLYSMGYRRFDVGGGFSFIKLKNNIIQEVQSQQIQDAFFQYLKTLPEQIEQYVTKEELTKITIKKIERLFGKILLSVLTSDHEILFNVDNKHESFVYYKLNYRQHKSN